MKTILIADDNEVSRELIREMLGEEGYRFLEAATGSEALALAERQIPDLILLDLHMPELNGFAVIERLRGDARFCRLPVLALTASAMNEDRKRALAAGFDEFITKPVRPAALRAHLKHLLRSADPEADAS